MEVEGAAHKAQVLVNSFNKIFLAGLINSGQHECHGSAIVYNRIRSINAGDILPVF